VKRVRNAFTLIEIMVTVLIITILLTIAVPNFIRARETARGRSCIRQLRLIDSAKEQYAMDNHLGAYSTMPALSALCGYGSTTYIKGGTPVCPSSGTYTVNNMGTDPACSIGTGAAIPHVMP
jgi:prepilin-type N-terminal cleavage/methylation domain-containing protein